MNNWPTPIVVDTSPRGGARLSGSLPDGRAFTLDLTREETAEMGDPGRPRREVARALQEGLSDA